MQDAESRLKQAQSAAQLLEQKLKGGRYSRPEVARVQAQAAEARATYQAAQDLLNNSNITAPRDGMVYALPFRESAFVNQGDLVVAVANLKNIQVRAFVDEPDIGRLGKRPAGRRDLGWTSGTKLARHRDSYTNNRFIHGSRTVGEVTASGH